MKTRVYLESLIDFFFNQFPKEKKIDYAFDSLANTHFILVSEDAYNDRFFPAFDDEATHNAYVHGIQGQICFTTDAYLLESAETFYNRFNNDLVVGNLDYFIDVENFGFDLSVFGESRFRSAIPGQSFETTPGPEYLALAA